MRETERMNGYSELQIKAATPISIDALGEAIDGCLSEGWERSIPYRPSVCWKSRIRGCFTGAGEEVK